MTASVQAKRGLLYIMLSYHDGKIWKRKWVSTNLKERGNKRKAEAMIPDIIRKWEHLECRPERMIASDITVKDFLDKWIAEVKNTIRVSTYEGYVYRASKIQAYFEDFQMRALKPQTVQDFINYELAYGKRNQKTGENEPLAVRTVREYRNVLSLACDKAVFYGLLKSNPCKGIKVSGKTNRSFEEDMLFMTKEELSELIHFLNEDDEIFRKLVPMVFICAYYGLRRSELLGLKWKNIDFAAKRIKIRETVVRVRSVQEVADVKSKASRREPALFPMAERMLLRVKEKQEQNQEFFGNKYHKSEYVFTWEDGTPYDPNYISRTFSKAMKKFGRPEITLHKLRHSCASLLLDMGWDIKKVQHWLGHEDAQTTLNIYAHYVRHRDLQDANDLAEITADCQDLF